MNLDWKKIIWVVIALVLVLMLASRFLVGGVLFSPGEINDYGNYFWLIIGTLAICLLALSGLIIKSGIKQRKEENEGVNKSVDEEDENESFVLG